MACKLNYLLAIVFSLSFSSCLDYNLSGSSLSEAIKTVTISTFPNYAPLQNPQLSQLFTNELQDTFDQRTKLTLTEQDADMLIEGEITGYRLSNTTVVSGDQAAQNRLTITVKVRYINNVEEDKSFDRTFTDFEDFEGNQTLQQVESELVELINERLINQIFNAIVADW